MTELPVGWALATIEELAASHGVTDGPFGSNLKTEHYTDAGPRVVRLQNIGDGVFRDEKAHISTEHFESLAKHSVQPNDVLVASLGELLPRACLTPESLGPAIVKADCIRVRPGDAVHPTLLMWALNAPQTRDRVGESIKGVGRPRVNLGVLRGLELHVPPLAEQERIVSAIEEASSKLDAGEAGLHDVLQRLNRTRDAILAAAVTGRLVGQDPSDTPAARLLTDIGAEATDSLDSGSSLPETWTVAALAELSELITDGDHRPPKRVPSGIPHLTAKNVRGGRFDFTGCSFVTEEGFAQTRSRYEPLAGDVIVTCVGTIGRVAVVPHGLVFSADRNLAAVRPKEGIEADYVRVVLESPGVQRRIGNASGSTAQPHLYLRDLRAITIPVPPVEEQRRIVAEVERQMSFIDGCERSIGAGLELSSGLRRSVLKSAFEGRLVPQDPTDEPASVLLEHIRAERAATPKPKKRRAKATT